MVVKTYRYDAFGFEVAGMTSNKDFTYTGREYHTPSGLYYYRNRFYHPELGRFISQDPIGHAGGMNLYAYVGNDPVNWVDPLGLKPPGEGWQEAGLASELAWDWLFPAGLSSVASVQLGKIHPYAVAILPAMEFGGAIYMASVEMEYQENRGDLVDTANRALASGVDVEIVHAHLRGVDQRSAAASEAARLGFTMMVTVATVSLK